MGRRSLAVLWVCLMVSAAGSAAAQNLDEFIHAKAYCIMDADTGKGIVLFKSPVNAAAGQYPKSRHGADRRQLLKID